MAHWILGELLTGFGFLMYECGKRQLNGESKMKSIKWAIICLLAGILLGGVYVLSGRRKKSPRAPAGQGMSASEIAAQERNQRIQLETAASVERLNTPPALPQPQTNPMADVQRTLNTVEDINRINRLNQQQQQKPPPASQNKKP